VNRTKAVFCEAALVAAIGLAVGLVANAVSPRGLPLGRNYFPASTTNQVGNAVSSVDPTVGVAAASASPTPSEEKEQRLKLYGIGLLSGSEAAGLFRDPRYKQGLVVFIDDRDEASYQTGHIPGAWQFHHYRAEDYMTNVLPVCLNAEKIVVYCTGGDCEDSEFAAIMLRQAGVPPARLFVYAGGITEWADQRLPMEVGARNSGQMIPP
jgi:rhodanese-related sulfurtransferase